MLKRRYDAFQKMFPEVLEGFQLSFLGVSRVFNSFQVVLEEFISILWGFTGFQVSSRKNFREFQGISDRVRWFQTNSSYICKFVYLHSWEFLEIFRQTLNALLDYTYTKSFICTIFLRDCLEVKRLSLSYGCFQRANCIKKFLRIFFARFLENTRQFLVRFFFFCVLASIA